MIKPEFPFTVLYDIITSFVFTSGETEHEKRFLPEFVQLAFVCAVPITDIIANISLPRDKDLSLVLSFLDELNLCWQIAMASGL